MALGSRHLVNETDPAKKQVLLMMGSKLNRMRMSMMVFEPIWGVGWAILFVINLVFDK